MIFEAPGITLSTTGRAMAEGGMGESIPVLNPISHRQIDAIVSGTGTVRVGGLAGDRARQTRGAAMNRRISISSPHLAQEHPCCTAMVRRSPVTLFLSALLARAA